MYVDGEIDSQGIVNHTQIQLPGYPKYEKQFLVIGQEPDEFKGGFYEKQLLQGKVSQFNWWSYLLNISMITSLADCEQSLKGDVIPWKRESFMTMG